MQFLEQANNYEIRRKLCLLQGLWNYISWLMIEYNVTSKTLLAILLQSSIALMSSFDVVVISNIRIFTFFLLFHLRFFFYLPPFFFFSLLLLSALFSMLTLILSVFSLFKKCLLMLSMCIFIPSYFVLCLRSRRWLLSIESNKRSMDCTLMPIRLP